MESTLNNFSLLWNNITCFNNISTICDGTAFNTSNNEETPGHTTDYESKNDSKTSNLKDSSDNFKILVDIPSSSSFLTEENREIKHELSSYYNNSLDKWNILFDIINLYYYNIMKLYKNLLYNLTELTLKEISLHNNFKYINQNYNTLLTTQHQLNMKISRMEYIYNYYNNFNVYTKSINDFVDYITNLNQMTNSEDFSVSSRRPSIEYTFNAKNRENERVILSKLEELYNLLNNIIDCIKFFTINTNFYKSEFYKNRYNDQYKQLILNIKFYIKYVFNHHLPTTEFIGLNKHNIGHYKDYKSDNVDHQETLVGDEDEILKSINKLLFLIKDEVDIVLQVEMYYVNYRINEYNSHYYNFNLLSTESDLQYRPETDTKLSLIKNEAVSLFNNYFLIISYELLLYNFVFNNIDNTGNLHIIVSNILNSTKSLSPPKDHPFDNRKSLSEESFNTKRDSTDHSLTSPGNSKPESLSATQSKDFSDAPNLHSKDIFKYLELNVIKKLDNNLTYLSEIRSIYEIFVNLYKLYSFIVSIVQNNKDTDKLLNYSNSIKNIMITNLINLSNHLINSHTNPFITSTDECQKIILPHLFTDKNVSHYVYYILYIFYHYFDILKRENKVYKNLQNNIKLLLNKNLHKYYIEDLLPKVLDHFHSQSQLGNERKDKQDNKVLDSNKKYLENVMNNLIINLHRYHNLNYLTQNLTKITSFDSYRATDESDTKQTSNQGNESLFGDRSVDVEFKKFMDELKSQEQSLKFKVISNLSSYDLNFNKVVSDEEGLNTSKDTSDKTKTLDKKFLTLLNYVYHVNVDLYKLVIEELNVSPNYLNDLDTSESREDKLFQLLVQLLG